MIDEQNYVCCQARLRIDPGDDTGRCPAPAKGAYVLDVDRGVRVLCGLHGNMGARVTVGPMDMESSALPKALVEALRDAHGKHAALVQARISTLVGVFNAAQAMVDKCGAVIITRRRAKEEVHDRRT